MHLQSEGSTQIGHPNISVLLPNSRSRYQILSCILDSSRLD